MNSLTLRAKPANAKYAAKVIASPDGDVQVTARNGSEFSHFGDVEIAWYPGCIKVTIPGGTPAAITQAYMTGKDQDVIVEISRAADSASKE